jgi:signal peptidase II
MIMQVVIGFIMGGAFGNLIDRALFGKVIDFLDVEFFDIPSFEVFGYYFRGMDRWPIFNVADMAVSIGFVLITYVFFIQPRLAKNESNSPQS